MSKAGPSQKLSPGYQKTTDGTPYPKGLGGNSKVTKPKGPGAGKTRGGASQKVVTRIKT